MKFFLSYASSQDKASADLIKKELEALDGTNPHEVFIDYESLLKSQDTDERINNLIEQVDAILYLITVSSVRSFWCGKEVGYAQCLGKPIIPIAGPGITDEFIKGQSVPWISALKWVNWWEKDRARKIVESMAYTQGIVELMSSEDMGKMGWLSRPGSEIFYGLKNNRQFSVFDLRVRIELHFGNGNSGALYGRQMEDLFVCMDRRTATGVRVSLSTFRNDGKPLHESWILSSLQTKQVQLERCRAKFLLRYCIGGQQYLTRVLDTPLLDVCSSDLRATMLTTAGIGK
jgi:hypothetical protein